VPAGVREPGASGGAPNKGGWTGCCAHRAWVGVAEPPNAVPVTFHTAALRPCWLALFQPGAHITPVQEAQTGTHEGVATDFGEVLSAFPGEGQTRPCAAGPDKSRARCDRSGKATGLRTGCSRQATKRRAPDFCRTRLIFLSVSLVVFRPQASPQAATTAFTSESNKGAPSVLPWARSTTRSGCGIMPRTRRFSDSTPAISATEPLGLLL
jgi:hypothetical protein